MKDTFTAPLLFVFFWGDFLSCGQVAGGSSDVSLPPLLLLVGILHRGPACFSLHWLIRVKSKPGVRRVLQIDFPHAEARSRPRRRLHLPEVPEQVSLFPYCQEPDKECAWSPPAIYPLRPLTVSLPAIIHLFPSLSVSACCM